MRTTRLLTTGALTAGLVLAGAVPALAQPVTGGPVVTGGLVNVTVTDVADVVLQDVNVGVGAALGLAANVCGVGVNVLATQLGNGTATCTSDATGQTVTLSQV